ncbi:MAG: hypothetical protein ACFNLD_10650 [Kingella oralis]|uniref:Uncharacterized protein n=1 Tax=Kingella oralis ATCC 51147 TaxID=629741 RepID=C4GLE2_9NEIS|nr:hypothetical protein GCWU000324_01799 [Kingella oralis ATCC 51147]
MFYFISHLAASRHRSILGFSLKTSETGFRLPISPMHAQSSSCFPHSTRFQAASSTVKPCKAA